VCGDRAPKLTASVILRGPTVRASNTPASQSTSLTDGRQRKGEEGDQDILCIEAILSDTTPVSGLRAGIASGRCSCVRQEACLHIRQSRRQGSKGQTLRLEAYVVSGLPVPAGHCIRHCTRYTLCRFSPRQLRASSTCVRRLACGAILYRSSRSSALGGRPRARQAPE
jgi:hypothetical protein